MKKILLLILISLPMMASIDTVKIPLKVQEGDYLVFGNLVADTISWDGSTDETLFIRTLYNSIPFFPFGYFNCSSIDLIGDVDSLRIEGIDFALPCDTAIRGWDWYVDTTMTTPTDSVHIKVIQGVEFRPYGWKRLIDLAGKARKLWIRVCMKEQ